MYLNEIFVRDCSKLEGLTVTLDVFKWVFHCSST